MMNIFLLGMNLISGILRFCFIFYFVLRVQENTKDTRKILGYGSIAAAVLILLGQLLSMPESLQVDIEVILLILIVKYGLKQNTRPSLFFLIYGEIGMGLIRFLFLSAFAMIGHTERFFISNTVEHVVVSFLSYLCVLVVTCFLFGKKDERKKNCYRLLTYIFVFVLFFTILLNQLESVYIPEEQISLWMMMSIIMIGAIIVFTMAKQNKIERENVQLREEQTRALQKEYQTLKNTYAVNARLYHDFHNHLEVLYQYLLENKTQEATQYLETMREPVQKVIRMQWFRDEAMDYLVSSKLSAARNVGIRTQVEIEYPEHTGIQNVDLASILGNLLDNSIEAVQGMEEKLRFLSLIIRRVNSMLIIKVENGCDTLPDRERGELVTSKEKNGLHGWGLKSVRTSVEKYDGSCEITYEKTIFRIVVILPFRELTRR